MHVCIILLLLLPLLLLLLLFISRFISGFGCRYTRSVRKKWNVDVKQIAWTILYRILISCTTKNYSIDSWERKRENMTDATAVVLLLLWSLTHFMRKYRPTKCTLAICAYFFLLSVFFSSFVCLFCWQFFFHIHQIWIFNIKMHENALSMFCCFVFRDFVLEWFIYRWDWMIEDKIPHHIRY